MRLIDADGLLQVIRKNIPKNPHDEYQEGQEIGLSMAVEMVCNEPTVDTEPIIRCKDCKYWKEDVPHNAYCEIMKIHGFEPDDFCSRGERAE